MPEFLPFVRCEHPVTIYDRLTHTGMFVPCRKCVSCENTKRNSLSLKLRLEFSRHRFCQFITLTYNNFHLPVFTISDRRTQSDATYAQKKYDSKHFILNPVNDRIFWDLKTRDYELTYEKPKDFSKSISYYNSRLAAYKKLHPTRSNLVYGYDNRVALLYYRDAQLWLKRLRKKISKYYPNEKIRYYIVGEYGTESLRPHWHCLLFYNSCELSREFENVLTVPQLAGEAENNQCAVFLHSLWKYGVCTSARADDGVNGYIASYVSLPADFPRLIKFLSPQKTYHSIGLGSPLSKEAVERVYKTENFGDFLDIALTDNKGVVQHYSVWRSIYSKVFPRLPYSSSFDAYEISLLYDSFERLSDYLNTIKIDVISNYIYDTYIAAHIEAPPFLRQYLRCYMKLLYLYDKDDFDCKQAISSMLRVSKNFYKNCFEYGISKSTHLRLIRDFYKYISLNSMRQCYSFLEQNPSYEVLYNSTLNPAMHSSFTCNDDKGLFKQFIDSQHNMYDDSIKHRKKVAIINSYIG